MENKEKIIPLTQIMEKKLKHLTILTMATQKKTLPYDELMEQLDIKNVRHLEDIIIEAIYAGEFYVDSSRLLNSYLIFFRAH